MRQRTTVAPRLLLAVSALALAGTSAHALTEQQAIDILVNQVIDPPTLDHDLIAFTLHDPLEAGDEVRPFIDAPPTVITETTWFFWIDDRPKYKFTHATRFVFIKDATGTVTVEDHIWFPVLNEVSLWREREDYWNNANWAYSRLEQVYDPNAAQSACKTFCPIRPKERDDKGRDTLNGPTNGAVVVNGTDEDFMQQDKIHMEDSFFDDGYEVYNVGPDTGNSSDDFATAIDDVINSGCTNVTLYISSHGGHDASGEDYFMLGDEKYTESDLQTLLDFYATFAPQVTFKFIFDFCHCGSFKETFEAAPNAVFWHFACGASEESGSAKPDYHNPDCTNADPDGPSEFPGSESTTGFYSDLEKIKNSLPLQSKLAILAAQYGIHFNVIKYLFAEITSMRNDECARAGETTPYSDARIESTHIIGASPARVDDDTHETYAIWRYQAYVAPDGPPVNRLMLNTLPGQYLWGEGGVLESPATLNLIQTHGTEGEFPPDWQGFYDPGSGTIIIEAMPGAPPLTPGQEYHFQFNTMALDLGFIDYGMFDPYGMLIPDGSGETFGPAPFSICNDPFADADGDLDVDQQDFAVFQLCFSGDGNPYPEWMPFCTCMDRPEIGDPPEPDGDVDEQDFDAFEFCTSGANVNADPLCDGPD